MADTVNIPVNKDDGWTEIVATGEGFFSASQSCQYCLADVAPTDDFYGHRLTTAETKRHVLTAPSKLFMKADTDMVVVLTEDD